MPTSLCTLLLLAALLLAGTDYQNAFTLIPGMSHAGFPAN
jgi:hypothetical protein